MRIAPPSPAAQDLLESYYRAGGVLEFVFCDVSEDFRSSEALQVDAALSALQSVVTRLDAELASTANLGIDDDERHTVPDGYHPTGRPITLREFLGPIFDNQTGFHRSIKNGYTGHEMAGLAYAFTAPPYGMKDADPLFLRFRGEVFQGFPGWSEIWAWDTDGLTYFDAGREWWGTYYWTVRTRPEEIIAILGSTTD